MINNNIIPINLYNNSEISTDLKFSSENNIANNKYIEIPENITNFKKLLSYEKFPAIKQQYVNFVTEIANLYNYFTETHDSNTANLNQQQIIKSSINNMQFKEQEGETLNNEVLFYSYNSIRKAMHNIIEYLSKYKDKELINNDIAIVCSTLQECFDICLEGFNSKIIIASNYIEYIDSDEFSNKVKCRLKTLIQSKISEVIILKKRAVNIHNLTAIFNLVATDYNFDLIVDSYANLYDYGIRETYGMIKTIKKSMTRFDVCNEVASELYILFKNLLEKTDKSHWLDNSIIEDFTSEDSYRLESLFLNPLNKYLEITDTNQQLSIRDIICEHPESYNIYLADVKDLFHFFIAKNINKFSDFIYDLKFESNTIAVINNDFTIINVNNCYFYIKTDNQEKLPLKLHHIKNINVSKVNKTIYSNIFTQTLEQTKSTAEIYDFLTNININKIFFNNKNLLAELNNRIKYNEHFKTKLISAISCDMQNNYKFINSFMYTKFIKKNILTIDILVNLVEKNIDVFFYITFDLSDKVLYKTIITLSYDNVKKIIRTLSQKQIVCPPLKIVFYLLFKENRWKLLEEILTSNLKFVFFDYLYKEDQIKAFKMLLENSKYNIASYFVLDYLKLKFKDFHKNNILYYIFINNDKELLLEIIKKIPQDLLIKFLAKKNIDGFNILMLAVLKNQLSLVKILLPHCNEKIINQQNKEGLNAIMLAIENNSLQCFQELAKKATKKMLTDVNKKGNNILMEAIINKCDAIITKIIGMINDDISILKQSNKSSHNNDLGLSIINKNPSIDKIINKSDYTILKHRNKQGYNSLMLAAICSMSTANILLLLKNYNLHDIYEKTQHGNNPLMLAASSGNINMINYLLEYYDTEDSLNVKNNNGYTALMLASEKGNLLCLKALLNKATSKILLENKDNNNSLLLAINRKKHKCILPIIEKYEQLMPIDKIDYNIWCAIMHSILEDAFLCLETLLTKANDKILTMISKTKYNILMTAVYCKRKDFVTTILNKASIDIHDKILNQKTLNGNTAVMIAAVQGDVSCLEYLLEKINPETLTTINHHKYNSLMLAVYSSNAECVKAILKKIPPNIFSIILNQKSSINGNRALDIAIQLGNNHLCFNILQNEINNYKNNFNKASTSKV